MDKSQITQIIGVAVGAIGLCIVAVQIMAKRIVKDHDEFRESTEKKLDENAKTISSEIRRLEGHVNSELQIARERSHSLATAVGAAVNKAEVAVQLVTRLESEFKTVSAEVNELAKTVIRLGTIVDSKLTKKNE